MLSEQHSSQGSGLTEVQAEDGLIAVFGSWTFHSGMAVVDGTQPQTLAAASLSPVSTHISGHLRHGPLGPLPRRPLAQDERQ